MIKRNKITWLLILQAWTMLWVVIGHSVLTSPSADNTLDMAMHKLALALFSFAYSFHMPLFIMISGYLFYNTRILKGWKYLDMVKEKWLRLGIPYFGFITLAIILKFCVPGEMNRQVDVTPVGIINNYLFPFNGALQEMWFVSAIFIYFIIYPLYKYLLSSKTYIILTLLISIVGFYLPINLITSIFALNQAVHFFVFFFIGILIARFNLNDYLVSWKIIGICLIITLLSSIFGNRLLMAMFTSFSFWGLAINIDKTLTSNLFHTYRNYTYQIFLIGIFVQIFVKILAAKFPFSGSYFIYWFICILAGIYIPVLISRLPIIKKYSFISRFLGL